MTALGFLGRLNGVGDRRPLKRFTPPRKLGEESGSDYSDSEYSDSESYSDSYSYTSSSGESEDEDETLRAIRATARAKSLKEKFEKWEQTQDARDQQVQLGVADENGQSLETAGNLRARFEALNMSNDEAGAKPKFRPKRFK